MMRNSLSHLLREGSFLSIQEICCFVCRKLHYLMPKGSWKKPCASPAIIFLYYLPLLVLYYLCASRWKYCSWDNDLTILGAVGIKDQFKKMQATETHVATVFLCAYLPILKSWTWLRSSTRSDRPVLWDIWFTVPSVIFLAKPSHAYGAM